MYNIIFFNSILHTRKYNSLICNSIVVVDVKYFVHIRICVVRNRTHDDRKCNSSYELKTNEKVHKLPREVICALVSLRLKFKVESRK
jgi:hypothetical protein